MAIADRGRPPVDAKRVADPQHRRSLRAAQVSRQLRAARPSPSRGPTATHSRFSTRFAVIKPLVDLRVCCIEQRGVVEHQQPPQVARTDVGVEQLRSRPARPRRLVRPDSRRISTVIRGPRRLPPSPARAGSAPRVIPVRRTPWSSAAGRVIAQNPRICAARDCWSPAGSSSCRRAARSALRRDPVTTMYSSLGG